MSPAGFKPAIPASERPQTQALDRSATGIHLTLHYLHNTCTVYALRRIRTMNGDYLQACLTPYSKLSSPLLGRVS